ncbi:mevalonate kinase-like [Rosa chinensis]|uniref:mevalonate kinase-like n=1 Tax=Rosa chinensis TaxID=74649 RepID=UPI001AD90FFB|nr:mevalonate kinase-like [Rosa chinensis]
MEVKARAVGKIILFGEHAVVHGSTAVSASIDLCTYATLCLPAHSDNNGLLRLELKDIGLEFLWPVGRIKEALSGIDVPNPSTPTSCPAEVNKSLAILVEELNILEAKIGIAAGVWAFLWLCSSIQGYGTVPATVIISSELPLGSGLGLSAALCVAFSGALLAYSDYASLDFSHQGWLDFGGSELDLLNKWAFEGEKIIHGKPSGIDNTAHMVIVCHSMLG